MAIAGCESLSGSQPRREPVKNDGRFSQLARRAHPLEQGTQSCLEARDVTNRLPRGETCLESSQRMRTGSGPGCAPASRKSSGRPSMRRSSWHAKSRAQPSRSAGSSPRSARSTSARTRYRMSVMHPRSTPVGARHPVKPSPGLTTAESRCRREQAQRDPSSRTPHSECVSTIAAFWPRASTCSAVVVENMCMTRATAPVQPVWWLAPIPAPSSPWKYS